MKPKSLMLLLVAGACGLVAAFAVTQHLAGNQPAPAGPAEPRKAVIIAVSAQEAGTVLKPTMVKSVELPASAIPPGSCTSLEQVQGETLRVPIFPGEVIIEGKLNGADTLAALAKRLPAGMVAGTASVKDADGRNAGLITPGAHVDVYWLPGSSRVEKSITQSPPETLLQNIQVLAVGQRVSADGFDSTASKESQSTEQNYTLLVTPAQNKRLITAGENGKIRLTLRSQANNNDSQATEEIDDARIDFLLGRRGPDLVASDVRPKPDGFECQFIKGGDISVERLDGQPATKKSSGR